MAHLDFDVTNRPWTSRQPSGHGGSVNVAYRSVSSSMIRAVQFNVRGPEARSRVGGSESRRVGSVKTMVTLNGRNRRERYFNVLFVQGQRSND
jgi:hypothetical protein